MKDFSFAEFLNMWFDSIGICSPAASDFFSKHNDLIKDRSIYEAAIHLGFEIVYLDLPDNVYGYAYEIQGTRYIVVNRHHGACFQEFTIAHEIAHHILHMADGPTTRKGMEEVQAHHFAVTWIIRTRPKEFGEFINQNLDAKAMMFTVGLMTGVMLLIGGVIKLGTWLQESKSRNVEAA